MKRILFLFNILFAVVLVAQAQPTITFDKNVQELGYVLWRNPMTITYNFTNTGDKPLVISKVTSSCGCTEVDWTKSPIPAGGKGTVTAVFDAEAIGHFYKEVGIYCNASYRPIYLEFNGEVTADARNYSFTHPFGFGAIRLDKDEIEFKDVNKGDHPEFSILVANTSNKAYSPVLMHLPPYLSAKAVPEVLGRGKNGKIIVTLDTDPYIGVSVTLSGRQSGKRQRNTCIDSLVAGFLRTDRTAEEQSSADFAFYYTVGVPSAETETEKIAECHHY